MRKPWTAGWAAGVALLLTGFVQAQAPAPLQPDASAASATFRQYCITCHNAKLKTGGVVIDPAKVSQAGDNAELWEKVDQKLRARGMPPAGMPRPDEATYDKVAAYLETTLDRAAAAHANAGDLPNLHRLTRTEYRNAVRDLLGVDHLPEEMDYSLLLPADNSSSDFDNIADLLFISPVIMQRYIEAAQKISRLAVGDPNMPVMVNMHRLPVQMTQDAQVADLSFGTRGGLAVNSYFPLDADYVFKVELAGAVRQPQQLEITVDGARKELVSVGGKGRGRGAPAPMQFRLPVKAGPRLVGVTFVMRTEALDENTVRPRMRSRGTLAAIGSVTISGPYNQTGPGDTPSREKIFVCTPKSAAEETPCARRILSTLLRKAYRRPVTETDLGDLLPFYRTGLAKSGFDLGIEKAIERLLVSPEFLYRIERDPEGAAPGSVYRISDLELASRLSFFLWSSIPDDELLNLAVQGKLRSPGVLEKQVRRMLADPRAESLVTNFAEQWLFLRDLKTKEPDLYLFRDFDETLRSAMERETDLFLDSVLRGNRSVLELLTANYSFLNERLAEHYGIPGIQGSEFRRVTFLAGSPRGGLLGQGSILTLTSQSTRTSPVLRGKYILQNLLASPPPPPPPNVPALKTEGETAGETLTMRQAMERHRANPACASCHARMDPIGFAMENFDAVGRWRDTDDGKPIDVSGVLPDGSKFQGMAGLKEMLLKNPQRFVGALTQKLLMFAIGRNVQYYDMPAVRAIVRQASAHNYTFASLVQGVVESVPFQMRTVREDRPSAAVTAAVKPQ
jgi:mono/diheme cytochrome c family protein